MESMHTGRLVLTDLIFNVSHWRTPLKVFQGVTVICNFAGMKICVACYQAGRYDPSLSKLVSLTKYPPHDSECYRCVRTYEVIKNG